MGLQKISELERSNLALDVATRLRDLMARGDLSPGTHWSNPRSPRSSASAGGPSERLCAFWRPKAWLEASPAGAPLSPRSRPRMCRKSTPCAPSWKKRLSGWRSRRPQPTISPDWKPSCIRCSLQPRWGITQRSWIGIWNSTCEFWKVAGHQRLEGFLREIGAQAKMYIAVQTSLYDDLAAGISDHRVPARSTQAERRRTGEQDAPGTSPSGQ